MGSRHEAISGGAALSRAPGLPVPRPGVPTHMRPTFWGGVSSSPPVTAKLRLSGHNGRGVLTLPNAVACPSDWDFFPGCGLSVCSNLQAGQDGDGGRGAHRRRTDSLSSDSSGKSYKHDTRWRSDSGQAGGEASPKMASCSLIVLQSHRPGPNQTCSGTTPTNKRCIQLPKGQG